MKKWNKTLTPRIFLVFGLLGTLMIFLLVCVLTAAAAGAISPWCFVTAFIAALFLVGLIIVWIVRPYRRMEEKMELFLDGYMTTDLDALYELLPTPASLRVMRRVGRMMDSAEILRMNKRQAQYLALQNQINPHFLYNTLESIRSEALLEGLTSVADMTEALATFFRYTISKVENLVSVEEELANCETYFSIQKYRFGERLHLEIECNPEEREEIYRCRMPKLTMQPILENSIIHGTECKIDGGHLKIRLELSGRRLSILISDDGCGMDAAALAKMNEKLGKSGKVLAEQSGEAQGGIALVNVNNRIHLLFGEEYGLHVFSMPGVGTDVEITLPAITNDREIQNKEALRKEAFR